MASCERRICLSDGNFFLTVWYTYGMRKRSPAIRKDLKTKRKVLARYYLPPRLEYVECVLCGSEDYDLLGIEDAHERNRGIVQSRDAFLDNYKEFRLRKRVPEDHCTNNVLCWPCYSKPADSID